MWLHDGVAMASAAMMSFVLTFVIIRTAYFSLRVATQLYICLLEFQMTLD